MFNLKLNDAQEMILMDIVSSWVENVEADCQPENDPKLAAQLEAARSILDVLVGRVSGVSNG